MAFTPYYPGGWQSGEDGGTPITPDALNHMDDGIVEAHDKLGEGFSVYPGSSSGGQLVQILFVPTESNLAGKRILLIPNTTTGIALYNATDSASIWVEFTSKDVTGTTSTSGNINVNLDPRTYVVYQVYSSTVNQICTAFRGANNSTFVHVTTASGATVAETNVSLKVFYRKVADNLYSY